MKTFGKAIVLLWMVLLTACNSAMETPAFVATVVESPTAIPVITSTPLPFTQGASVSGEPTTTILKNELTWRECIVPNQDYAYSMPDVLFAENCLNMEYPSWNDDDRKIVGEQIEGMNWPDLRQVVGNDIYLVKLTSTNNCCHYEFSKNGKVLFEKDAPFTSFNPSRNLWNIGGQLVWELVTDPPTIIVDGVNYNEKYQLDGVFMPYSIHGTLIYIAKTDGRYHLVYDEEIIGPEFDEIYIRYCCATTRVLHGSGRYWFWGKREGKYYVVGIQ